MCSFFVLARWGRKPLLEFGYFGMAFDLFLMVFAIRMNNGILVVITMVMFQFFFQTTMGPIHWFYLPEVLNDAQFGFVATFHYSNGIEISMISEYMLKYMKAWGMFLYYAIMTTIGFFFMKFVIKETAGLTDKEKMVLYKK